VRARRNLIYHRKRTCVCTKTIHLNFYPTTRSRSLAGDVHRDDAETTFIWITIAAARSLINSLTPKTCAHTHGGRQEDGVLCPNEFLRVVFIVVRQLNNFNRFVYSILCGFKGGGWWGKLLFQLPFSSARNFSIVLLLLPLHEYVECFPCSL
jgi:hypothetical protein